MTYQCPMGHASDDADFCSVCGSQIEPAAAAAAAAPPAMPTHTHATSGNAGVAESCPKCSEVRDDPQSPFCGVCGYDYVNKVGGDQAAVVAAQAPSQPAASSPVTSNAVAFAGSTRRVDVTVTVAGQPARKYSLFEEQNLIGRSSSAVQQAVGIDGDDGVSRRHLMIEMVDGKVSVRDVGSANGTVHETADGAKTPLANGEQRDLAVGDRLRIGASTVITVEAIVN